MVLWGDGNGTPVYKEQLFKIAITLSITLNLPLKWQYRSVLGYSVDE